MRLASVLLTAVLLMTTSGSAQKQTSLPHPIEFKETVLPNGLRIVTHEDHSTPVCGTFRECGTHVGSKDEKNKGPDRDSPICSETSTFQGLLHSAQTRAPTRQDHHLSPAESATPTPTTTRRFIGNSSGKLPRKSTVARSRPHGITGRHGSKL